MQRALPIDTYKKDVDELVKPNYKMDWEETQKGTFKFMVQDILHLQHKCQVNHQVLYVMQQMV